MKRNHDFSSSDSELDETIEVEKESADENGQVLAAVMNFTLSKFCENKK